MHFPPRTPRVVKDAVEAYSRHRAAVAVGAALSLGLGAFGLTLLAYMTIDRLVEWPVAWRQTGHWASGAILLLSLLAVVCILLRRDRPLSVAIRLDQGLPSSEDRWSTSLDIAGRQLKERSVGRPEWIEKLYQDTQSRTSAHDALSLVSKRKLKYGAALAASGLIVLAGMHFSVFFTVPLLWTRFWNPHANLPRDSLTQVHVVSVVGPITGSGAGGDSTFAVPENEAFTVKVRIDRKGQPSAPVESGIAGAPGPVPRFEVLAEGGKGVSTDFTRSGDLWIFTRPDVTEDLSFRIRAADALTQTFRLKIEPRIRITSLKHTIRYPGYTKLPEVKEEPLERERLSLIEDSRLIFSVECDRPISELSATFDLLEGKEDPGQASLLSPQEQWQRGRGHQRGRKDPEKEKRRRLRVKIRKETFGTFRMRVDHSGILRIQVVGKNGLAGLERVCVIEAVRDLPPRVTVLGLEPDTHIVPGELVGFQYRAEDDLAVSDVYMDWRTAGSARTGVLAGEAYLHNRDFGQKVVTGGETIQRMNYHVYGTEPYEFNLFVVDSKGQESRSGNYRIHLLSDTFAARFKSGMVFFEKLNSAANLSLNKLNEMKNQLNIVAAAAGEEEALLTGHDSLLADLATIAAHVEPNVSRQRAQHRFSGWPQRLHRSAALLLVVHRCLDPRRSYLDAAQRVRTSSSPEKEIAGVKKRIALQFSLVEKWKAAIGAESHRFAGEALLQDVRNLQQRIARTVGAKTGSKQYVSNQIFYLDETRKVIERARNMDGPLADRLRSLADGIKAEPEEAPAEWMLETLQLFERALVVHAPPISGALSDLLRELQDQAAADGELARRLLVAVAETMDSRDAEASSAPVEDLFLFRHWVNKALPDRHPWYRLPVEPVDLWLMSERLGRIWRRHERDTALGRYELNPGEGDDVRAEIREQALVLKDLLSRCTGLPKAATEQLGAALQEAILSSAIGQAKPIGPGRLVRALPVLLESGLKQLREGRLSLGALIGETGGKLNGLAQDYDAFASRFEAQFAKYPARDRNSPIAFQHFATSRRQAEELQSGPKAIEMAYRNIHFLRMVQAFAPPGAGTEWEDWEPWHGLQLLFLLDGLHAFSKVTYRFNYHAKQSLSTIPGHARTFAEQLRRHGRLLGLAVRGAPLDFDFEHVMKDSRTLGFLETLKKELEVVSPVIAAADQGAASEALEKVTRSQLGRIVGLEGLLPTLAAAKARLGRAESTPAGNVLQTLKEVQSTLSRYPDRREIGDLGDLVERLAKLPASVLAKPPSGARLQQTQAVTEALAEEVGALSSAVQIPPINLTRRGNVRWQSSEAREYWPIRQVIENFDRRWLYRMREAELSLLRDLITSGHGPSSEQARGALALSYARLVELRSRQVAHERRRNRGISYLVEDTGPALKLPPHIAQEFMRARNRRPPEQFKEESEAYFRQLYRDLSR